MKLMVYYGNIVITYKNIRWACFEKRIDTLTYREYGDTSKFQIKGKKITKIKILDR